MRQVRRAFQDEQSQQFIDAVESATGRKVKTFLSQHEPDQEISIEVFLLEPDSEE